MRRQLVPGPVVRLTVIKAKTRPGIEARIATFSQVSTELEVTKKIRRLINNRDQPPLGAGSYVSPFFLFFAPVIVTKIRKRRGCEGGLV